PEMIGGIGIQAAYGSAKEPVVDFACLVVELP
ncbi:unnamed protein product, partial [marine sediment metagenome]